jgi:acetaldehyde dehydrogenase (acetylating)
MTMAKIHVLTIAAGLLLAVSGPSVAANAKNAVKSQSRTIETRGSANSGSAIRPYSRDDPYAPGVNWPGKW